VVALSVTEGADKPLKYPAIFRKAGLVLLTKIDLLPHLPDVSVAAVREALGRVAPQALLLPVSARSGEGLPEWFGWLRERLPAGSRA
jgi:hydrogenase nickel incorporation protein HypB